MGGGEQQSVQIETNGMGMRMSKLLWLLERWTIFGYRDLACFHGYKVLFLYQAGWSGVPKCDVYQALGCFKKGGFPSLILKEPSGAWCCNRG